ncbi:hypothetical protein HMPREF1580_00384 [Gardnerella vaginalis JCP8070]|nr:hypothetical protein HMPREF1580_00384 [Gardnerella vaginalis JCP8070]EPI61186.1 hypothetical protein HMPREF1579_00173 [Gardnerella vaginalis JCP8066]
MLVICYLLFAIRYSLLAICSIDFVASFSFVNKSFALQKR